MLGMKSFGTPQIFCAFMCIISWFSDRGPLLLFSGGPHSACGPFGQALHLPKVHDQGHHLE